MKKREKPVYPFLSLTDSDFSVLYTILCLIQLNAKSEKAQNCVRSNCEFMFDVDYGAYDEFRDLVIKFREAVDAGEIWNAIREGVK